MYPRATDVYYRQEEPDFGALRCTGILLGLTGFALLGANFLAGILSLCLLCKIGCCCGDPETMKRAVYHGGCCCCRSLQGLAVSIAVLCGLWLPLSYFVLGKYVSNICGAMVTDYSSTVGQAAFTVAKGVLETAAGVWQAAHPDDPEPRIVSQAAGDFGMILVYPPAVCDPLKPATIKGYAHIYFPRPFSSFSDMTMYYMLGVNGLGLILACLVACFASSARKTLRARSFVMPAQMPAQVVPVM